MESGSARPKPPAAAPRLSATILLVRDGSAGLEVFLVERHHAIDFATGALVFPGGKVDPGDADPRLAARCAGASGLEDAARTLRIAAIRETFEECGVLLARPRGAPDLVDAERLAAIEVQHRGALLEDHITLAEIAEREDLELAVDLLVPFAHWITPEFMPKRFDTHFFLVAAPQDQAALHDGSESVDSVWMTPASAVAAGEAKQRTIVFPTLLNLKKLGRSASVSAALTAARRLPVVTVLPRLERRPEGPVMRLPAEAGYGLTEASLRDLGAFPTPRGKPS